MTSMPEGRHDSFDGGDVTTIDPVRLSSRAASCYLRVSLPFPFISFFTLCILVNSTFIMYYY